LKSGFLFAKVVEKPQLPKNFRKKAAGNNRPDCYTSPLDKNKTNNIS
jgi:hypothetical protein